MIDECTFKQLEVSLVRLELSTKCSLFSIVLWSKKKRHLIHLTASFCHIII